MKGCILIAITLCLFGCNDEDSSPSVSTVHLAGFLAIPAGSSGGENVVASYWKDSVYTDLTHGGVSSNVTSLSVDGSSVLIGGSKFVVNTMTPAVVWRDGTETIIDGAAPGPMIVSRNNTLFGVWLDWNTGWVFHKNGTSQLIVDTAYNFAPMAMTIVGDDVYASGYSSGPATPPNYSPPQHAQYWKNGNLIFRESEVSNGLSIFVHRNDVYVAGLTYVPGGSTSIACYWKNGQRVDLTGGGDVALARSVFVTDTHVYVSGMMNDQAVYWKDGEATALTTEGTNSMANAIFVKGPDVHVAGYAHGYPAYWKNDVKQNIQNQHTQGQIKFIFVGSN